MPTTSPEKIVTPTADDAYALTADLRRMMDSARTIVPVANSAERNAVAAALVAAGTPPTTERPLYVDRMDAPGGYTIERTTNGTTWFAVNRVSMSATDRDYVQAYTQVLTPSVIGGTETVFPIPFTTICRSVVITPGDSASDLGFVRIEGFNPATNLTKVSFRCYTTAGVRVNATSVRVNVIAVGQ